MVQGLLFAMIQPEQKTKLEYLWGLFSIKLRPVSADCTPLSASIKTYFEIIQSSLYSPCLKFLQSIVLSGRRGRWLGGLKC